MNQYIPLEKLGRETREEKANSNHPEMLFTLETCCCISAYFLI